MVTKQTYRDLLMVVNHEDTYDVLKQYAEERIAFYQKQLENAHSWDDVKGAQQAIYELRRITTLRDEVIAGAK